VKIRGLRIELGEIEARLLEQDEVREAAVLAVEISGGLQLVAYLVPTELSQVQAAAETQQALRETLGTQLRAHLPDYMVPSHFILLERLPLSPNGKLERKALPKPDARAAQRTFVAPRSALEVQLASIWQDVLGLPQVGATDSFFDLGGHSLLATQVMSRVRQLKGADVPLSTLFEHPSLAGFALALDALSANALQAPPLLPAGRDKPLPMSYAQERQWFLWQLEPQSTAYHLASALRLRGRLDAAALQRSFDVLVARHESLRTVFIQAQGQTHQLILPQGQVTVEHAQLDLAAFDADGQAAALKRAVQDETQRLFDLTQGPLLRARLIRLDGDDHALVVTQHHIISDGWSLQRMVEELIGLYADLTQDRPLDATPAPLQYADYAVWQRQWMEAGERERQLAYWTEQLAGDQAVLALPCDYPRPAVQSFRGASHDFSLDPALFAALKDMAQASQASLFMLLLASFQVLLHRYSGQREIRVGVPVANRNRLETEGLLGFFVNTQVLKAELQGEMPFVEVLAQVRQAALDAQAHQDLPFEQLVEALHPQRSLSHTPLFQVMYNHHDETRAVLAGQRLAGVEVEPLNWGNVTAQFDLTLDTYQLDAGMGARLTYACDLFEAATIARLAEHWQRLLQAIVEQPQQCVAELPMLVAAEQARLHEWNAPRRTQGGEPAVHRLIQAWAERSPQAVALLCGEQAMGYGELEVRANRLAHYLMAQGVGPEVRVGIALERGFDMIVGLLAVLKAGGAYVPLDPQYPQERLAYLMQDSAMTLLLSHSQLLPELPAPGGLHCLAIDQLELTTQPAHAPDQDPAPQNLAYVIYTSGSTGQPKGVAVPHGPLAMHCLAIGERYAMSERDCELHFMSFAFDGAHERWLTTLSHGGRLLIRDSSLWTAEQTYQAMHRHGVTVAAFPPAYLQQLAEHAERDGNPPPVRIYCFGGDAVAQASFELAKRALRPQFIINGYGPTETVVTPLIWKAGPQDQCGAAYAPIGSRIGERSAYVCDSAMSLLPVGLEGELYLGGEGVARGYLNRPSLTAERFVPDALGQQGGRLYRSGDRVRQRADGTFDYLGRVDHQVKVRGFRIELGEIEACLQAHPGVREAVVLAQPGPAGPQLVGYLVAGSADAVTQGALRDALQAQLREALPAYMVPSYLLFIEQLPLTPNGKLDRKALPQADASQLQQLYVAPQGELEQHVAQIWAQVLKLGQVGRTDNFFELGGHSLLATQVTAMAQQQLQANIPLDLLFKAGTLHEYASAVGGCLNGNLTQDLSDMHDFLTELETL
ncbi:amino acid adenylation domain-containing protein, partial [Pseudomonas sp. NPDC089752]|uniref:amino acid adenylation domain-containing protein n=1 Tax=Pseudomonas sp. NPDC089752 TaxID=3364472 RepID=UPI0037F575FE